MELVVLIVMVIMLAFSTLSFYVGYKLGTKVVHNVDKVVNKSPKLRISKYNAGDLLDPISPSEQRLERSLEMKKGVNEDAE